MKRFGRYLLYDRIAAGGMAEVFYAESPDHTRSIALKKILPQYSSEPEFVRMFIDEANLLASLQHPNIVEIVDLGVIDGCYFLAMEYVQGLTLGRLLSCLGRRRWQLPLHCAILIARGVASGLAFAHGCRDADGNNLGLVHRDISPPNILIALTGEIKIIDFGVALTYSSMSQSRAGSLKGKIAYMSPEQARGEEVDQRSDLYSLGSVLHLMVEGTPLFTAETELGLLNKVQRGAARPATRSSCGIPLELETILSRALALDPGDRYQAARELERELYEVVGSAPGRAATSELAAMAKTIYLEETSEGRLFAPENLRSVSRRLPKPRVPNARQESTPVTSGAGRGRQARRPSREAQVSRREISTEIRDDGDVVTARTSCMKLARRLGMKEAAAVRVGTVVSDLARTILKYSGTGTVEIELLMGPRRALRAIFRDQLPDGEHSEGKPQIPRRRRFGMGIGVATARKLVDHFAIETSSDGVTTISATIYLR